MSDISMFRVDELIRGLGEEGIPVGLTLIGERTIEKWGRLMEYIPTIEFPEPEGHYHYILRRFKERIIGGIKGFVYEAKFRLGVLIFGLDQEKGGEY